LSVATRQELGAGILPEYHRGCSFSSDAGASLISRLGIRAIVDSGSIRANGIINETAFMRVSSDGIAALTNAATGLAHAGGGDVAAGLIGGLAAGTIIGAAVAGPRYYALPPPVYVAPGPSCYWTRGQPMWDGYEVCGCTRAFRFASRRGSVHR